MAVFCIKFKEWADKRESSFMLLLSIGKIFITEFLQC